MELLYSQILSNRGSVEKNTMDNKQREEKSFSVQLGIVVWCGGCGGPQFWDVEWMNEYWPGSWPRLRNGPGPW